jgi:hypothetical protein
MPAGGWGLADAARRLPRVCAELEGSRDLIVGLAEGKIPPLVVHVLEGRMSDEDEADSPACESGSTDRPTQGVSPNRLRHGGGIRAGRRLFPANPLGRSGAVRGKSEAPREKSLAGQHSHSPTQHAAASAEPASTLRGPLRRMRHECSLRTWTIWRPT